MGKNGIAGDEPGYGAETGVRSTERSGKKSSKKKMIR